MWRIYIKKTHSHTQIQKQTNKAKQKKRSYKSICTRAVTTQSSSAHDCQGRSQKIKGTVSRLCARASVICLFFKRQYRTVILTRQDFLPDRTADGDLLFIFSSNTLDFRRNLSSYLKFGSRHEDLSRFYR